MADVPPEIAELQAMIEDAGSVDAAMELIRERMHPNGMCGCCGQPNPVGAKLSSHGIPACSMACAYHLLHPEDTKAHGHVPEQELQALRVRPSPEDLEPGRPEGVPELRR